MAGDFLRRRRKPAASAEDCADPGRPSRSRRRLAKYQRLYRQALDSARSR